MVVSFGSDTFGLPENWALPRAVPVSASVCAPPLSHIQRGVPHSGPSTQSFSWPFLRLSKFCYWVQVFLPVVYGTSDVTVTFRLTGAFILLIQALQSVKGEVSQTVAYLFVQRPHTVTSGTLTVRTPSNWATGTLKLWTVNRMGFPGIVHPTS